MKRKIELRDRTAAARQMSFILFYTILIEFHVTPNWTKIQFSLSRPVGQKSMLPWYFLFIGANIELWTMVSFLLSSDANLQSNLTFVLNLGSFKSFFVASSDHIIVPINVNFKGWYGEFKINPTHPNLIIYNQESSCTKWQFILNTFSHTLFPPPSLLRM